MLDEVLYEIGKLKWVFVIDFSIIIFLCALLLVLTTKFNWKRNTVRIFGVLYNLNYKQAICFSLMISRICFIITNAIYISRLGWGHLVVLIFTEIVILVLNRDFVLFGSDVISFTIIFFLQYIQMSLYDFYLTIDSNIIIIIMVIMIGLFSVLFSMQQSLHGYETIITRQMEKKKKVYRKKGGNIL